MRVVFDQDFDHGAWPGPLEGVEASFGEAWVGPGGMLGLLETALGLGAPNASEIERMAALVPAVRGTRGFWSESAAVDALGTARRLLAWRQRLVEQGWTGQGVAPRIAELAAVTQNALPGSSDRLRAVCDALGRRRVDLEEILLLEERDELSVLWRRALGALEKHGARVTVRRLTPAKARGDLAAARATGFDPKGDGSLQLVRPHAPLAAAEAVAAWLAAQRSEKVVVIGGDEVLDRAFARFGLPTIGVDRSAQDGTLAQLVALVLAAGWSPPDPQRVLELLSLPLGPVPGTVAYRLADALREVPAVGSPGWIGALAQGLAAIEDEQRRARVRERLDILLVPRVPQGERYPVVEVRARLDALGKWLRARGAEDKVNEDALGAPLGQIAALEHLLASWGMDALSLPELWRFVGEASRVLPGAAGLPAEAGLSSVSTAGALAGAADVVVWWNFSRESAPTVARQRFTSAEVKALASVGVILPDPGVEAVALARRWRRPLEQACGTLLLVCPERDLAGESLTPHPLWDEIVANLVKGPRPKTLETAHPRSSIAIAVSPRPARAVPSPTLEWHVPAGKIVRREVESPSGAGDLLGCPLKWVLGYTARLHAGRSAVLPTGNRLAGTLAHDLLAQILPDPKSTPETARKLFREQGPTLAAELFLPGAERNRAFVERVVVESARFLLRMIRDGGMRVKTVEEEYSKPALGGAFSGRTDLVLDSPLAVVDLKFAGHSYHRGALEDGTAFQLAAYAYLVAKNGNKSLPPVAYFILANQHLISTDRKAFPDADVVDGPAMADVWRAAERTYTDALERLQSGTVTAPGNGDEPPESGLDDGTFTFGAECGFCDFDAVCGQAFSEAP